MTMNLSEHAEMSRNVREYFQCSKNTKKYMALQVADIATMTNKRFINEKLQSIEQQWNFSFSRQDYPSLGSKDSELDSCKLSFNFWTQVADLKGLGQ